MTNSEQRRLTNWRLKMLQAATRPAMWRGPAGISGFLARRSTSGASGITRTVMSDSRTGPGAAPLAAGNAGRGRQQDPLPPAALPLRPGEDCRLPEAVSRPVDRLCFGPSHSAQARHEPAAGESKVPATRAPLDALREGAAGPSAASRRQVSRAHSGTRRRFYQFTAIDDCTRIRVLKVYDACNQRTAIAFIDDVLRRLPFRVHVIQTDNGAEFQSHFHWHLEERDIRHVYIRPRTPHLNGKVERSHRVDDQEFYQLLDKDGITDDIHLFNAKLKEWEDYYNYHRPHGALAGQTPYERLVAKTRAGALPAS